MDQSEFIGNAVAQFMGGNTTYTSYNEHWQYLYESYIGGEEYRNAQHLTRYNLETPGEYGARLKNAVLTNHCSSIVSVYTSFLFKNPPDRFWGSFSDMPQLEQFLEDADKDGRNFNNFMKDCAAYASVFGMVWVVVSKPETGAITRADELAQGVRPYVSMLTPLVVLDWEYDRAEDGHYHLGYFKYLEDINGNESVVKEWYMDRIVTTIVDQENDVVKDRYEEPNELMHLPIVPVYNKRSLMRGVGISDISDIADAQRMIYNLINEIDQGVRLDGHPSIVTTENTRLGAGAGSVIQIGEDLDPGLKPYILQSSGANIKAVLDTIDTIVSSIDKQANTGAIRATESRTMSGVAMEVEFGLLSARLAEKGAQLALAEEQILEHFGHYYDINWDGRIKYPESFNIRNRQSDLDFLLKANTVSVSEEYKKEVARQITKLIVDEDDIEIFEKIINQINTTNTFSSNITDGNTG